MSTNPQKKSGTEASAADAKKPKKTKSRNGCVTCKKRRLKCDETKPLCQNCIKKGIVCGGYAINFKWRDFSDTATSHKSAAAEAAHAGGAGAGAAAAAAARAPPDQACAHHERSSTHDQPAHNPLQKALEEATLSVTGKSAQEIAIANVLIANGKNPELAAAVASTLSGLVNSDDILQLVSKKGLQPAGDPKHEPSRPPADRKASRATRTKTERTERTDGGVVKQESEDETAKSQRGEADEDEDDGDENEDEADITHAVADIQPKKLVNTEYRNNNLLHSLADIASKVPASPVGPLSPFSETFHPTKGARPQKPDSFAKSPLLTSSSKYLKTLPPLHPEIVSKTKGNNPPLTFFKDSPQAPASFSPSIFPRSPNNSGLLSSYPHANFDPAAGPATNSNVATPRFVDEMESYSNLQQFAKFSPMPADSFQQQYEHNDHSMKNTPGFPAQHSPQFYSLHSILSGGDPSNVAIPNIGSLSAIAGNEQFQAFPSVAPSPLFEIETPKPGQSNPASPYTTMLNYINATQLPDKIRPKIEEQRADKEVVENSKQMPSSYSNFAVDASSPRSVASDMSSTLDIFEHPNRPQSLMPQNPVNLYSLHLSDENLTTLVAFDQYTCGIMSIKNGPTENPWRTFLLPMSVDHPVVRSALLAMTCFHVARGDPMLRARGVRYMKDAIVTLVHSLSSDNSKDKTKKLKGKSSDTSTEIVARTPPDVALATCIALAMGEAWDRHISTGIAHLKGAKSMIIRVLNKLEGKKKSKKRRSSSVGSFSDAGSVLMSNSESNHTNSSDKIENLGSETPDNELHKKKLPKELQFLVNAWMYFDVLARMTSENDDDNFSDSDDEEAIDDVEYENFDALKDSDDSESIGADEELGDKSMKRKFSQNFEQPSKKRGKKKKKHDENNSSSVIAKFRNFNLEDGDTIDPLLGIAQTLFPIMSDVATLIEQVRRAKVKAKAISDKNSKTPLRLISRAVELKTAIERWKIPPLPQMPNKVPAEDPTFDLNAAVATAEAYRYATLLYLHQTVPEVPSQGSHSLAENVMMLLASVPGSSRTLVTHMFPLFVASCEAKPGEEREWARERWTELIDKMWIGTIERAWEVVKEVWARKDALSGKKRSKIFTEKDPSLELIQKTDDKSGLEYNKVKRRISMVIHGNDEDLVDDEDNMVGSWTHWTTVMREWGWEVLLA